MNKKPTKSKKIVIDTFYQLSAITGIFTYTHLLCEVSKKCEDDYDFRIVPSQSFTESNNFFRGRINKIKSLMFHLLYLLWKQVFLPIYVLIHKPDALICPDYVVPMWKLGTLKIPVIHSTFFWEHPENYSKYWLQYYKKSIRLGFRGNTLGVTTSEYTRTKLQEEIPWGGKLHVVYQTFRKKMVSDDSEKPYVNSFGRYVFHVGYFDKRKNIPFLVEAFIKMIKTYPENDLNLVLAGTKGSSSHSDDLGRVSGMIEENSMHERIFVLGHVTTTVLDKLYKEALMYVFPSKNEGFGIPILEAMDAKIPVIISDSGPLPEVGGNAVLIYSNQDQMDLIEKMTTLASDESLRRRLINSGTERLSFFSEENFLKGFLQIIDHE